MPWARKGRSNAEGGAFARYGAWLERNYRWAGALALVVMIVLALPIASLRLGFTDDSGKAEGNSARVAYDLLSDGFGPGTNGPFIVAVQTTEPGDNAAVQQLAASLSTDPGVAAAVPFPMEADGTVTAMQGRPHHRTAGRSDHAASGAAAHRGHPRRNGRRSADRRGRRHAGDHLGLHHRAQRCPTGVPRRGHRPRVPGAGPAVPVDPCALTGAITSLLSLAAAMGVTVAVFQWGWAAGSWASPGRARSCRSCRSWSSPSCSACPWTTRCSWSAGCRRSGCTPDNRRPCAAVWRPRAGS